MPKTIVIRPQAQTDVDEETRYLAADDPDAAARFLEDLHHAFDRLFRFPHLGRPWPTRNPELVGLRRWPLPTFSLSVFYRPTETTIDVVRVLHHARDIPPLLENP